MKIKDSSAENGLFLLSVILNFDPPVIYRHLGVLARCMGVFYLELDLQIPINKHNELIDEC